MSKWLITGVHGFLGANACRVLAERVDVVGLARSKVDIPWCSELVQGDLRDQDALMHAVESAAPDVVLHCAALADHQECERDEETAHLVNATGSAALARAAQEVGAEFVYVSTDAVFSGDRGWYAESDNPCPITAYGRSKAAGEDAVSRAHVNPVILRTNFFGWSPSGQRSILEFFESHLRAGKATPGYVNYTVTSAFVGDVIDSIHLIVESSQRGIFHSVARDAVTKAVFGRLVAEQFGYDGGLIKETRAAGPDRDLSLTSQRLADLRGADMPSQAEGIARSMSSARFVNST